MPSSLFDKIWQKHLVASEPGQPDLIYIDRHLIHEVTSPQAFEALRHAKRAVRRPDLTFAVIDHSIPTTDRHRPLKDKIAETQLAALEKNQKEFGIKNFFPITDPRQGVIHVTMPEQGIILPGQTIVCGDSHTATHGAFGSIAFGIGTSEVEHVLATQTLPQIKPKQMKIEITGQLQAGVYSKDLILYIIRTLGMAGATGYAIEYTGDLIKTLSMEARMTLSNMAIECGARMGLIAPDEITFNYLKGRPYAPAGNDFERAKKDWLDLKTNEGFKFDKVITIKADSIVPQATWGTNPAQGSDITGKIPNIDDFSSENDKLAAEKALKYQDLPYGYEIAAIPINYVFIGSCTNGRIEDLLIAAEIFKNRKVKDDVTVLIVPGSGLVKKEAEKLGLDKIFIEAGCQWREAGCSMCLGMNPDLVPAGLHCASTSNRNFEDRQGRGSKTHLVSPATAAASAITGHLTDPRTL